MKEGTYVQHRTRSEWGIGRVLHRTGDRAQVQFAHGLVLLDLRIARPLFEQVAAPAVPIDWEKPKSARKSAARPRR